MAALLNAKHEEFCRGIIKGLRPCEAYVAAGYTTKNELVAAANASRLLNDDKITSRIRELQEKVTVKATAQAALDRKWIIDRLMKNARIALGEEKVKVTRKDDDGVDIDVDVIARDASAANKALELLGKTVEMGLFVDKQEVGSPGEFAAMTTDELVEYVRTSRAALIHDGTDTEQ